MSVELRWSRLAAEGGVIVCSVLVALAADAFWQDREARAKGREDLGAVLEEVRERRATVEFVHEWHMRALDGMKVLQADLGATPDGSRLEVSDTIASQLMWIVVSDPVAPTLDAYLASGHLERLENPQLRLWLLRWRSMLDDIADDEARASRHIDDRILPFLQSRADVSRAIQLVFTMYDGEADPAAIKSVSMPVGPDLKNLVSRQISMMQLNTSQSGFAIRRADEIIALIEDEIG